MHYLISLINSRVENLIFSLKKLLSDNGRYEIKRLRIL